MRPDAFPERLYRWLTPPDIASPVADRLAAEGSIPPRSATSSCPISTATMPRASRRFPNATVHCSRAGLRRVWGRGRVRALVAGTPRGLLPPDLPERCAFFEDSAQRPPEPRTFGRSSSGADLLGDGSLLAVPLPGHCPGHWGLRPSRAARTPLPRRRRGLVVAGDPGKPAAAATHRRLPRRRGVGPRDARPAPPASAPAIRTSSSPRRTAPSARPRRRR